jgi:hypothetical protein
LEVRIAHITLQFVCQRRVLEVQVSSGGAGRCQAASSELTDSPGLYGSLDVAAQDRPLCLQKWLADQGAPEQAVCLETTEVDGLPLDITVASRDIKEGETVLRIPDELVVTLDQVFEDETVAEVLTTDKLSELACLTLYLMCATQSCTAGM